MISHQFIIIKLFKLFTLMLVNCQQQPIQTIFYSLIVFQSMIIAEGIIKDVDAFSYCWVDQVIMKIKTINNL